MSRGVPEQHWGHLGWGTSHRLRPQLRQPGVMSPGLGTSHRLLSLGVGTGWPAPWEMSPGVGTNHRFRPPLREMVTSSGVTSLGSWRSHRICPQLGDMVTSPGGDVPWLGDKALSLSLGWGTAASSGVASPGSRTSHRRCPWLRDRVPGPRVTSPGLGTSRWLRPLPRRWDLDAGGDLPWLRDKPPASVPSWGMA